MKVTSSIDEAVFWSARFRSAGLSLGLVPTMGALHQGHFSLIKRSREECDRVAVSIFVNPTQFGPGEDYARYPRTTEADLAGCQARGVDLVLVGEIEGKDGFYPEGFQTWVEVGKLSRPLCGRFRPQHFRGVATVVTMLLDIFRPHRAYFGQKDFQQARLIRKMAKDLRLGIDVRMLPTVRDPDGLAVSSRNHYLTPEERRTALSIPRALLEASKMFEEGEERASVLQALVRQRLESTAGLELQYAEALDAETLEPIPGDLVSKAPQGAVLAVAGLVGKTRLIDNVWLWREEGPRTGGQDGV